MGWVGWAEEVRVETETEVSVRAILRGLETQVGKGAEDGEATDIKEQTRRELEWMFSSRAGELPRWIVPPAREEEKRKGALTTAQRIAEEAKKRVPEAAGSPEGEGQSRWRGLRRGRDGQMQFVLEGQVKGVDGGERQVEEARGGRTGQEENSRAEESGQDEEERVEGEEVDEGQ